MPPLRSRTVTHGRNMAGARALLRAAGVEREDFGKPIVAVAGAVRDVNAVACAVAAAAQMRDPALP